MRTWRSGLKRAAGTVTYRLSDNDIGVTRRDPAVRDRHRPGCGEALRLVEAHLVDVVLCWRWGRAS